MTMIDADKLKPALQAWQQAGAAVVQAVESAAEATQHGGQEQAAQMSTRAKYAARDRDEKAEEVALLVEALIRQAETGAAAWWPVVAHLRVRDFPITPRHAGL